MNVGMVGLGKLGLPVAVALGQKYRVIGTDVNPKLLAKRKYEHREEGYGSKSFQCMFDEADISFTSLNAVCAQSDIIFVAVQTPHQPKFEGTTRIPYERADFDYTHLVSAVKAISQSPNLKPDTIVVVISTCLPGTIRKHVMPLLAGKCRLVYNPFFIAMGTVVRDFYNPEFVLLGSDDKAALSRVEEFYNGFYDLIHPEDDVDTAACRKMSIESAELTKVAYNTFIGMKIAYANTLMEIAHKLPGCNVDDVIGAIRSSTDRLISGKYLTPGMGDGGGCHPRDNIAMSWLAKELRLSHDFFEDIMLAREHQCEWLARYLMNLQIDVMSKNGPELPIVILGKSFKPETNIVTGSPAVLVSNILSSLDVKHEHYDPWVDEIPLVVAQDGPPCIILIGTRHERFAHYKFPKGSIIVDPHRYIPDQEGVEVIRLGEHK